ncbi:LIM domain transcription factor LMO4 [Bombyx mandarina]|uniref:LIM zinc-binding domain-containing protein n=2 Tax=Bombyx TaxID=7090 RepID=A0A8R2HPQ5_BOMMO|nr:LIM domain transcription factor LMO4 [Bombyx mori]XP_021205662.1 LIM domain transcription factor LMO4 [Bombyx mori]XP_028033998.1 LIM domain transcription factor LMO4 [Bombyx mandarina]
MNPHYHGYAELSSPHPSSPEASFAANGHDYPHNNNNPALKECAGCGGKIVERFLLHALDRYWHHGCLKCTCCGQALADMGRSFYFKGGMILCKNDYTRMFGSGGACAACGQAIPASEFVMRTNAPQQPLHVFHIKCFACSKCGSHLMQGDRYYMLAGSLVCEQDWQKLMKSANATGQGATAPVRKGKVGRPRRSRE